MLSMDITRQTLLNLTSRLLDEETGLTSIEEKEQALVAFASNTRSNSKKEKFELDPNVILQSTGTMDTQENLVPYREAIGYLTFAAIAPNQFCRKQREQIC